MSDDIDRAQNEVERLLNQALRNRKPEGPLPTGNCLWCQDPTELHEYRWCSVDCRDMYDRNATARR